MNSPITAARLDLQNAQARLAEYTVTEKLIYWECVKNLAQKYADRYAGKRQRSANNDSSDNDTTA